MAKPRTKRAPCDPPTDPASSEPETVEARAEAADPVSPAICEFVEFFEREFDGVEFPQHDGVSLDAARLGELVSQVRRQAEAESQAQRALVEARAQLASSHRALLGASKQALAYARIYAAERAELSETLAKFRIGDRKFAPRKRAGSRKRSKPIEELELDTSQLKLAQPKAADSAA
jgi:multidrug efflux pump subunit AcrA (membrane-fusion protein)